MPCITFKKYHFASNPQTGQVGLCVFLQNEELIGMKSRARTSFLRLMDPHLQDIEAGVKEIIARYSEEKDGKTLVTDQEGAGKEISTFLNEELPLDVTHANLTTLLEIQGILKATQTPFKGQMATMYDEWCAVFEQVPIKP